MDETRSVITSGAPDQSGDRQPSLILAAASVFGVLATWLIPALTSISLAELMEAYGALPEDLGVLFVGNSVISVAVVLPIAFLADRFGYPYILAAVFGAASFCMLNGAFSMSLNHAIAAHVFATMLSIASVPVAVVLVFHSVSVYWRSTSIAALFMCPFVAGPLVALLLDSEVTRPGILIGCAIASAACATAIVLVRSRSPRHVRRMRPHIFDGRMVWLIAAAALFASAADSIPAWAPSLLIRVDETFREAIVSNTYVFIYPTVGALAGLLVGGATADLLGRRTGRPDIRIGVVGAALAAIAVIAAPRFEQTEFFFVSIAVAAFGAGTIMTLANSYLQQLAGRQFAVVAAAALSTAWTIGKGVGSGIATSMFAVFDRTLATSEALDSTLVWLSFAGLVAAALFYLARRAEAREHAYLEARRPIPTGRHSVFARGGPDSGDTEEVKNGFSWPAFFFGPIWALTKDLMPMAGLLLLVNIVLFVLLDIGLILYGFTGDVAGAIHLTPIAYVVAVLWLVWVGARGNSWRRHRLIRLGYEERVQEP